MAEQTGLAPDGEIETTEEGGQHSKVSYQFDDLDAPAMLRLGEILRYGRDRYGKGNWRKIPSEDHLNHALMHIFGHLAGDKRDDHLGHAMARLHFALALFLRPDYRD